MINWRGLRLAAALALGALGLAWAISLPLSPFAALAGSTPGAVERGSIARVSAQANWRDIVIVRLAINDIGVQQLPVSIGWSQRQPGGYAIQYRVAQNVLADGRAHSYVAPVGLHPEWRGDIRDVQVVATRHADAVADRNLQLVRRPAWALELWLGRLLHPYLAADPAWANLALCTAALLVAGVALLWPARSWRRRLTFAAVLLGCGTGLATAARLVYLVGVTYQFYAPLDEPTAMAYVTARTRSAQFDRNLIGSLPDLPNGPILVDGPTQDDYLSLRLRYLLYPRRIDSYDLKSPAGIRQLQSDGYVALIRPNDRADASILGWQRVNGVTADPAVWRIAGAQPGALPREPGRGAIVGLLAGIALVVAAGWCIAGAAGWGGWERLCCAWPIGASILAWWMFGLFSIGIAWSWWSIGLPLALAALFAIWLGRRRGPIGWPARPNLWPSWELYGAIVVGALAVCVAALALLVPFTDADTWRIWSFKARGFYIDSGMERVLSLYRHIELYHAGYPPAQPLVQTWGYLAMGGISERLVKLIFPIWYLACVGMTYCACRQWCSGALAMGWALLLASTPILLDHATLGNADLALAAALLLGGWALARWIESGQRVWLFAGALGLAGAAWIKLDGLYLGAGMIVLAALGRAIARRRDRHAAIQSVLAGSIALGGLLAAVIPWHFYAISLGLDNDIPSARVLQHQGAAIVRRAFAIIGQELLLSHGNSSYGLLESKYGVFWMVCFATVIANWRRMARDGIGLFLILSVVGGIGCYAAIYTLHPYYSIDRYLLHIAPLAVLAAARSARQAGHEPATTARLV
jgi:hypothetical protein